MGDECTGPIEWYEGILLKYFQDLLWHCKVRVEANKSRQGTDITREAVRTA